VRPLRFLHGRHFGAGERAIINTTRNFKGRMGTGAELYMGSAATVAASAIEGVIADPRSYL